MCVSASPARSRRRGMRLTSIVGAIEGTILRTSDGVGTQRGVPCVAGVTVVAAAGGVEPAPVRV